jgi:hypothetical protein
MKWFLSLPQWARLSIALPLALMMFVSVWHFNKKRQALEPVWASGEAELSHRPENIPLTVYLDQSFGDHGDSAAKAMEDMNAATCTLLVEVPDLQGVDIHIRHEPCDKDADKKPNHPGCAWLDPISGQVIIQVGQPGDITTSYLIFFHELTHAFGLAHDGIYKVPMKVEDSAMFVPITANNAHEHAYRLGRFHMPRLSDKDEAAMKTRYCGNF